jgi:hypothetical protein
MASTEWKIANMDRDGTTDEVKRIYVRVYHRDENHMCRHTAIVDTPAGTFTDPWTNLTHDQCVEAVKTILGPDEVTRIETQLCDQMITIKNPPIKTGLTWDQVAPEPTSAPEDPPV